MLPIRLFALPTLAAVAVAQVNPFVFYPQDPERQTITCTSFVGRPDSNRAAEALMVLDTQHFRGVGDANGVVRLFGIYHWLADERLATAETYDVVIRTGAPGGGPDMSAAGELLRIAGLTTPPSGSQQRGTWILSDGFGITGGFRPPGGTPTKIDYFLGVDLPASPNWPATDGHALFRADLVNAGAGALLGENHRVGAPNPTWAGRHTLPPFSTPWTYILGPLVTSPSLHVGGLDPTSTRLGAAGANLSMNGLYPDIAGQPRRDGLVVRMTDNLAPFGYVFLGASVGFQFPFYEGFFGRLIGYSHIGDAFTPPIDLGIGAMQNGAFERVIALPGQIPTALVGTDIVFQGIVYDPNIVLAEWTDAQAVHL